MSDHNKKYSSIQEKRIAKKLKGEVQIASGALPIASKKGDVKLVCSQDWKILIDGKTSKVKFHEEGVRSKAISKDQLNKIEQEAKEGGDQFGVLAFSFDNKKDYYILKDIDFEIMYTALIDYEKIINTLNEEISQLKEVKNNNFSVNKYVDFNQLIEEE